MKKFLRIRRGGIWLTTLMLGTGGLLAGCATGASGDGTPSNPTAPATSTGPSTTAAPISTAPVFPPIIHRPAGLSFATKVPLVVVLHSSPGSPGGMEKLTGFDQVADEHGFVVAYLSSSDYHAAWKPPSDLLYVSSEISKITASQNIDPSRVYVTGFSAGGFETYKAGCQLSHQVAAIAIVSDPMGAALANSCKIEHPMSELFITGSTETRTFVGVPGALITASQSTAKWRSLDGCPAPTPQNQQAGAVTQQAWSRCADGTAVALYIVQGGHHAWPGAPGLPASDPDSQYNGSEAIWAFLAPHRIGGATGSASLLSLGVNHLSINASGRHATPVRRRVVVASFRLSRPLLITEAIVARGHTVVSKVFRVSLGLRVRLSLVIPSLVKPGRYSARFTLLDGYGDSHVISKNIRLPAK
jgi:polyhydroxybutyrate depolymerase